MKKLVLLALLFCGVANAQSSNAYRVGKGLQLTPVASCATAVVKAAGNSLLCVDSSASNVLKYKNPAGTTITLGAGGGGSTLAASYASGAAQSDNTIALDSTRKGVLIRDNATPLATTNGGLFAVQDNGGTTNFIQVDQRGLRIANTATTGTTPRLLFAAPAAHTALTAAQELNNFLINGNTFQWTGGGSWSTQRFHVFNGSTISFTSSTTIPTAATLAINAAPTAGTNATLTNAYALWVEAGLTSLDGSVKTPSIGTSASALHALPSGTGDLVSTDATQTLTNKTLTSPVLGSTITGTFNIGGTPTATSPIRANLGATTIAPTWTAITYSNSWVDFGASATSRYTKGPDGLVTVEIRAKNGSSATAALNSGTPIAVGSRPGQIVQICGQTLAGAIACGDLDTSGVFTPSVGSTAGIFLRATYFAEN